jgi:DNA-binding transcriptional LysR family regulator
MADPTGSPDWSLVRVFLAVAETGSFSAAARRLRSSQPTVGRQVAALEEAVGAALFQRYPQGMRLTDAGADLLTPARAMAEAARALSLAAAGKAETMSGSVRITASVAMAHHVLPPIVARLRAVLPAVAIELVASDAADNLLFREADIAVRMFRPDQLDVVTTHLGDLALGIYGAVAYLDAAGRPATVDDLLTHRFVGYDRDDRILRGFREMGFPVTRDFFGTRTDAHTVYWELVRAGCGLGVGQVLQGEADPLVERVVPHVPLPTLPVWLTAHEGLRRTPRIRRVWEMLEAELRAALP